MLFAAAIVISFPVRAPGQTPYREPAERSQPSVRTDSLDVEAKDDTSGARFLAIGAGIGTPSGITFLAAGYLAPIALRVSGGYWGEHWNGVQGDIGILFNSSSSFAHGISVIGGVFRTNPITVSADGAQEEVSKMVQYIGAAYDVYLSGFFLQIGLAHGQGDYPNPQLMMQFGYLFAL